MADIFNDQRVVGVHYVADGTTMYNGRPVVGVVAVADGLFLVDNQRVVGGVEITDGSTFYNDQPVLGAVLISNGRKLYNNQLVTPLGTVGAASFAPYPAPTGFHWDFVTSAADGGQRVTSSNDNNQPVVALVANGS
ncbi:hypothetical protein IVB18_26225 [Bradyrhizobium sp. 186]|uniref:hypothetical protein n=1 Tax=Bradyrhizobium sp. 186 TaxID=2782654 RepID=UPI0020015ACD|nr:hypothetical protein [Bradyrhizobium sp. 186]UPK31829.1 hypothetical protein IVB18_26225 [Bradyrhizobium sp. 186]